MEKRNFEPFDGRYGEWHDWDPSAGYAAPALYRRMLWFRTRAGSEYPSSQIPLREWKHYGKPSDIIAWRTPAPRRLLSEIEIAARAEKRAAREEQARLAAEARAFRKAERERTAAYRLERIYDLASGALTDIAHHSAKGDYRTAREIALTTRDSIDTLRHPRKRNRP